MSDDDLVRRDVAITAIGGDVSDLRHHEAYIRGRASAVDILRALPAAFPAESQVLHIAGHWQRVDVVCDCGERAKAIVVTDPVARAERELAQALLTTGLHPPFSADAHNALARYRAAVEEA